MVRKISWRKRNIASENLFGYHSDSIGRTLDSSVKYVIGQMVDGDIAEFGTQTGATSTILAKAIAEADSLFPAQNALYKSEGRSLLLFDSFAGLPEIEDEIDSLSPNVLGGIWSRGFLKGLSPEELSESIAKYLDRSRFQVFDGYFRETLQSWGGSKLSLIHLDCDLYSSTIEGLRFCSENKLLSPGSIILFNDWLCNEGSQKFGQQSAWKQILSEFKEISYESLGFYAVTGKRLLLY